MPSATTISYNLATERFECEFDLDATGAVVTTAGAVRGDDIVVTKTGTGIYTVRLVGRVFNEVLYRNATLFRAVPTSNWAGVTDIDLDGAGDGTGCVITVKVFDDNATPTALNVSAVATVGVTVVFRRAKVSG